jgi:hypothetical protein
MIDSMKTNSKINVTLTKESDFKNWDQFFDQHYKRFVSGTTHKTHIFSANRNNKTTLLLRADDLPETIQSSQDLLKKGQALTPERLALLKSPQLESIVAPGIPPIKQEELFTKYRGLLPVQFQEITCPDPGNDIKIKIKSERNTKQRERTKAKRMKCKDDNKIEVGDDTEVKSQNVDAGRV